MGETLESGIAELQKICSSLDNAVQKAVAHRRKFQFAISQLRKFLQSVDRSVISKPATPEQLAAVRQMISITRDYHRLIEENILQRWAHTALSNQSNSIASELCDSASRLNNLASKFDENAAKVFDPASKQWLDLHLLDLRAISASFQEFAARPGGDKQAMELIQSKLKSIDQFFKEFDNGEIDSGVRVFSPIPVHYQSWRINGDDFDEVNEVASGASAVVWFGIMKKTGMEVAIKKLKFKKLSGAKLETFQRELAILAVAEHPRILKFIGATDTHPFSIVTEWMPNGSLYHDLHKTHKLDATQKTIVAFDIARAMQFLHTRQIIHRDLKSLNVLLDKDFLPRICDFGFSRIESKEEVMTKNVGTPHWMAPELLMSSGGYGNKVDVYSYAIVLWEILTSQLPYDGMKQSQIIASVLMENLRPKMPPGVPRNLEALMTECWARDPSQRPSFAEVVRRFQSGMIFFEGADEEKVMEYIMSAEPSEEESQQRTLDAKMSAFLENTSNADACNEFLVALGKYGIPHRHAFATKCWDCVQKINKVQHSNLYCQGCSLFLSSAFSLDAAKALRAMPAMVVPSNVVAQAIELVPTGSTDIDTELVVLACKNNFHAQAAVHAIHPNHAKLCLEVCGQKGVPQSWVTVVTDRCVKYLTSDDPMLIVSAMRCLIGIGKATNIGIEALRMNIQSSNETLKMASYVAAAQMAFQGIPMPADLVDAIASRWNEPIVAPVIVCACKNVEIAKHILSRLEYGGIPSPSIVAQILNMSAQHKELVETVKEQINRLRVSHVSNAELMKALSALTVQLLQNEM